MTPSRRIGRRGLILAGAALGCGAARAADPSPDAFIAFRKLYASAADEEVYWWTFATLSARADGLPDIPAVDTQAVRVCRVQSTDDAVKVTWKEIGCYVDRTTGEVAAAWTNPYTGEALPVARAFEEGVGIYTLTRSDPVLGLKQRSARPWRTGLAAAARDGRVTLDLTEVKTRAFPYADGDSPEISEPAALVNDSAFHLYGSQAQLADPSVKAAAAQGQMSILFGGAPTWMSFPGRITRAVAAGTMHKTAATDAAFPAVRARLKAIHPDYFRKGRISWD